MLNFGLWEMLMIAGVALIFVGPERLPEMLRYLGRSYGKLRAMTYDIRREFTIEVDRAVAEERSRVMQERRQALRRPEEVDGGGELLVRGNRDRQAQHGGPEPRHRLLAGKRRAHQGHQHRARGAHARADHGTYAHEGGDVWCGKICAADSGIA